MTLGNTASHPDGIPDSKARGANMGPTWVLSAPDGPHVGPMNLAIRDIAVSLSHPVEIRPGANSLSGEPDYFGRNKISSGGDLSHYSSASLY